MEIDSKETPIILKADQDASYGIVIKVFDLLRELNFDKITLGTLKSNL